MFVRAIFSNGICCSESGISRDSMHKRRATGGKKKAWRKKRKCVPLLCYLFIHFNFLNFLFILICCVFFFFFFCCLELPNVVAESGRCVCVGIFGRFDWYDGWDLYLVVDLTVWNWNRKCFFFLFCFVLKELIVIFFVLFSLRFGIFEMWLCVLEHMVDLGLAVLRVFVRGGGN